MVQGYWVFELPDLKVYKARKELEAGKHTSDIRSAKTRGASVEFRLLQGAKV